MVTVKKAKVFKKAEDGVSSDYKERQGNYPKEGGKEPLNKFPEAKVPEKAAPKFGEAFKAARAAGKSTFTWNGKSYTTKTKEDAAKSASSSADTNLNMAASMIKARVKQIDGKDLKGPVKPTPKQASKNAVLASFGPPPKKGGIAYKSKMKVGGKTKK